MPIYEYKCGACEVRFERRQSFQDDPIRECPDCGGETRRLLHAAGIIFKGSGWYVTDSRPNTANGAGDKTNGKTEKVDSTAKADSNGKSDSPSPTKTETGSSATDGGSSKSDAGSTKKDAVSTKADAGSGTGSSATGAASK
ncbi:MAG TPA: zinc ribbon domain-containing protein [Chloroflexota bacterium]|nr:zinc ribbon domain-containing protein [Chloroflexota bacterium]